MNVDSVITLDDGINCLLLEKTTYNNNNYFMAVVLDDEDEPSDDYVVFQEFIEEDGPYVEKVEDEKTLSDLLILFSKSFEKMVDNLPDIDN